MNTILVDVCENLALRFWRTLAVLGVALLLVGYILLSPKQNYEARSTLLFQMGRDYIYVPDASGAGVRPPDPGNLLAYVNAEMQILDSAPLRAELADKLIADGEFILDMTDPHAHQKLEAQLQDAISIALVTGSYIVDIRVRDTSADRASRIAKTLVSLYINRRAKVIGADAPEFLKAAIKQSNDNLKGLQGELTTRLDGRDVDAFEANRASLISSVSNASQALAAAEAGLAAAQRRVEDVKAAIADLPKDQRVGTNPTYQMMMRDLLAARSDLTGAEAQLDQLKNDSQRNQDELNKEQDTHEFIVATRASIAAETAHNTVLRSRLRDSELSIARMAAGSGTVRIIENGTTTGATVGVPRKMLAIATLMVSLFAGAMAAYAMFTFRPRLLTPSMGPMMVGLPVLAEIEDRKYWLQHSQGSKG